MVAPLDVHAVVLFQQVHNHIGPGAPVKDIPHHVEVVHRQPLDQRRKGDDEGVRPVDVHNGVDDFVVVLLLVAGVVVGVQQLIDDVGKIAGQGFAHLGTGVFGGDPPADFNEPVKGHPVPLVEVGHLLFDLLQLLFRVID